ncbi:MAG: OB-fold domain-containing protein [Marmoricola sp.]
MTQAASDVLVPEAVHAQVMAGADELIARGVCSKRDARDPVNQPTINAWLDAIGDTNPRWRSGEAPPAMAQVWTMYALGEERDPDDPLHAMMGVLTDAGFTGVLGTNCEQTYARTLRVGERPRREIRLESVVGPKATGRGTGYFVTSRTEWFVEDELVASMLFRVLKYIPKQRSKPDRFVLYPTRNRDNEYFWEGTARGELRIQRCNACGALRHPPGPSCPECHAFDRGHVVAAGTGTVFSHVTHHHPKIPGHALPLQVALVDLDEGVRMVAGAAEALEIGDRVQVDFRRIDDDLTLPVWKKVHA